LAKAVLLGETRGYRNHPQLERFKNHPAPLAAISVYLQAIYAESVARRYAFDKNKIPVTTEPVTLVVTSGQLAYEWTHLLRKLQARNSVIYQKWQETTTPEPHPMLEVRAGQVESWERQSGVGKFGVR